MQGYSLPFKPTDKVIELGGGDNPVFRPNVDVRPGPKVDITADLNERLPFDSDQFDGIFSQFLLEHLRLPKLRGFLSEVYRILKPNGLAVIICANLLEQARVLIEREEWNDDVIYMVFGGNPDYLENYHHLGLSPAYAVKLLAEAGFGEVAIYEHPLAKQIWGHSTDMIIHAKKVKPQETGVRIARSL